MAKAKPTMMRARETFCVGVRTINAGEELPADDEAVAAVPEMFEPAAGAPSED